MNVYKSLLEKLLSKQYLPQNSLSREEFKIAINKCNNLLAPRLDRILWKHLKCIVKDENCLSNIMNIVNACINLGYQLSHFKELLFIIIPKPNKTVYDSFKFFQPIVLLNMIGKLIEKAISEHLQYYLITNNFIYPNQLGSLRQQYTTDVGLFQTHLIYSGWVKRLQTSTLAFYIVQFFLSLNNYLIPLIFKKVGYNTRISTFFSDYLIGRKICYLWNSFISPFFSMDVGVSQGSAFSPILSILFITLIFYIFEKRIKNLNILISFHSFIDDGLFISQEKLFIKMNANLFCCYNIMLLLLNQFNLIVKYRKTFLFHLYFHFLYFWELRVRVSVMSHCHILVTLSHVTLKE